MDRRDSLTAMTCGSFRISCTALLLCLWCMGYSEYSHGGTLSTHMGCLRPVAFPSHALCRASHAARCELHAAAMLHGTGRTYGCALHLPR